jgi:hypothetical protein
LYFRIWIAHDVPYLVKITGEEVQWLLSENGEFTYVTFDLYSRVVTDIDSILKGQVRFRVVMHPRFAVSFVMVE